MRDAFVVLVIFASYAVIGIGPALWLLSASPRRFVYALAIAAPLGKALMTLIGLPLARYLGPIDSLALPLFSLLALLSITLWAWQLRESGEVGRGIIWKVALLPLIFFAACFAVLIAPLAIGGIQYGIFRSNPGDAFTYISMAETFRGTPWDTVMRATVFSPERNMAAMAALARTSPGGLYTARSVALPLQLNNSVTLAWVAVLSGVPVYKAYFPYHLAAFLSTAVIALALGDLLSLPRPLKYLGAAAIAIGYWARFVLETDASYEINSSPLLLLVVVAWIHLEDNSLQILFSRARFLLAISVSALISTYMVLAPFVVIAFAVYYGVNLLRRTIPFSALLYHGVTALLVLGILGVTGQLDLQFLSFLYGLGNVDRQRQFPAAALDLMREYGLVGVWGLPLQILISVTRRIVSLPIWIVTNGLALLASVLAILSVRYSFRRVRWPAGQIVLAVVASGAVFFLYGLAGGNLRASGKAFTYIFPYLIMALLIGAASVQLSRSLLQKGLSAGVFSCLIAEIALGAFLPFSDAFSKALHYPRRSEAYDLSPLTSYLEAHPPRALLVNTPRTESWEFPYYVMLVFGKYPAYFQSGFVIDNNLTYRNLWLGKLDAVPDYAIMLKSSDYVAREKWGNLVAETPDLAMYHLTMQDLTALNAQERKVQAEDAAKPEFKATLPQLLSAP